MGESLYFCTDILNMQVLRINQTMMKQMQKTLFVAVAALVGLTSQRASAQQTFEGTTGIIANPIDLNYRFQISGNSLREAADPVCEYYKGKYYLFASKCSGYWSSPDLVNWTYIRCRSIKNIEEYAPTIMVYNDELYYFGKGEVMIYKTTNPDVDDWQLVETDAETQGGTDLAWFVDDDNRVYLYWGCSNSSPIRGVEVDPTNKFKSLTKRIDLIGFNADKLGFEVSGDNNDILERASWNEGPCMIKHNGKYYLMYATPGTQYRSYCDAVYVSDNPLGPYEMTDCLPASYKPGGFIGGAGHGHTFRDKYGNYWHVATMKISQRHNFERRLCLLPVFFGDDDRMYTQSMWADYPCKVPDHKVDFATWDVWTGWNELSKGKPVYASSWVCNHDPELANDERVETWWAAQTGKPVTFGKKGNNITNEGEWWMTDLQKSMTINAIQVNFADHGFKLLGPDSYCYRYVIQASADNSEWKTIVDRSDFQEDRPHDFIVLDKPIKARYVRICNIKETPGAFSLYDFRIFGHGGGKAPAEVNAKSIKVARDKSDKRIYRLTWDAVPDATGYVVRMGTDKDHLNYSAMLYTNEYEGRCFRTDRDYMFVVDAFNENGYTRSR